MTRRSARSVPSHGAERFELADDAVAAAVRAGAARAGRAFEPAHAERVLQLDRLGGRVERVGHVALDGRRAVARRAGAAAAADRLVVRPVRRRPSATLLIVPQLAAGMRSGSACASAPKTTSTTRWLVSVFPATTAAGYCACRASRAA